MSDIIDITNILEEKSPYHYFFLLGKRDFDRGISFRDNPYEKNSTESIKWLRGWWMAFAEQGKTDV